MNLWHSLSGMVLLEAVSADPGKLMHDLTQAGISLRQIEPVDPLTVRFLAFRRDLSKIQRICASGGDTLKQLKMLGLFWRLRAMFRRPVLTAGLLGLLFLMAFLPTRVLFFRVEGNEKIPAARILEAAENCGIRFGASRGRVRSEKMKNALLEAIPELQWAGINTAGCTAVISVKERAAMGETAPAADTLNTIVAARDGIITACTVTRGNPLCTPGQAVKRGQVLISPYTDCGIAIRYTGVQGEIYAQTRREQRAVMPLEYEKRTAVAEERLRCSLIFGKKRINLWKDSGIWDTTCGRMYEEYYITLPGGFRLPVCLAVERLTVYETSGRMREASAFEQDLKDFAAMQVTNAMIAGDIQRQDVTVTSENGLLQLSGSYDCTEMIGREKAVRIGDTNE